MYGLIYPSFSASLFSRLDFQRVQSVGGGSLCSLREFSKQVAAITDGDSSAGILMHRLVSAGNPLRVLVRGL